MVFQKKGAVKARQQPFGKQKNKKQIEEEDDFDLMEQDSDDSDDGDSEDEVIKTPAGKTPKGKQPLSDKKVSFQIPGKNTPATTPKGGKPVKKQATPGKMALQEFKGMGAKNGKAKKQAESEEDDDDDDDDDEFDEDADLDMMLGGSDDDDDDDDEEDEDDDDDDDDDEDEEEEVLIGGKKQNAKLSQSKILEKSSNKTPKKSETPAKNAKTPLQNEKTPKKNEKTPVKVKIEKPEVAARSLTKAQSPQKKDKNDELTPGKQKMLELETSFRRERDLRTLYLGKLPADIAVEEIKALSNDIINVVIPRKNRKKFAFAFLEFANEAKAEENNKILQKKKLRGQPLFVDFTGEKSVNKPAAAAKETAHNFRKLMASSLPEKATIADVAKMFPRAESISMTCREGYKLAAITYVDEAVAAEELESAKDSKICGSSFNVLFATSFPKKDKKRKRNQQDRPDRPNFAKKIKTEVKQEMIEEDDDDDDDDDSDE